MPCLPRIFTSVYLRVLTILTYLELFLVCHHECYSCLVGGRDLKISQPIQQIRREQLQNATVSSTHLELG